MDRGGGDRVGKKKSRLAKRSEQMRIVYSQRNRDEQKGDDEEWKEEDVEEEAYQMIQWSQGLNIDDI